MSDAAIAVPITATLGGREFEFSPLNLVRIAKVRRWLMGERAKTVKEVLGEDYNGKIQSEIAREIMFSSVSIKTTIEVIEDQEGATRLLWEAAKLCDPGFDLSFEEFAEYCSFSQIETVTETAMAVGLGPLQELAEPAPEGEQSSPPSTKKSRTTSRSK
jgi:hypothetical protein